MNFNCKRFRLSTYKEHKVTGLPPKREFRYTSFRSGDNNGVQLNHALKIGLTTLFLKWRVMLTKN